MAAKIGDDAHSVSFDKALNGVADIAKGIARLHRFDPAHQRIVGDFDQPLGLARQLARHIHPRCVTEPAVDDHSDIDVQDVPILELFVAGDAVTDHVIKRNAAGVLIPLIADSGRFCTCVFDHLRDYTVDRAGSLADKDMFGDVIKDLRRQLASGVHPGEIRGVVNANAVFGLASSVFVHHRYLQQIIS